MKVEWLRLMSGHALDGDTLINGPDLMSQLYRWRDYAGLLDEPAIGLRR